MDKFLLFLANTLLCLIAISYNIFYLKRKSNIVLFPIVNIVVILTIGVAIPFIEYSNKSFRFPYNEEVSFIAFVVILIFVSITTFFLEIIGANQPKKNRLAMPEKRSFAFWLLLTISIIASIYFLFFSGGILLLGTILNISQSGYDYSLSRVYLGQLIIDTQGADIAFISSTSINSVLMIVILCLESNKSKIKRNRLMRLLDFLIKIYLIASTILISIIFGKRLMIVIALIFLFLFLYLSLAKNKVLESFYLISQFLSLKGNKIIKNIFIVLLIAIIPASVFSFTAKQNLSFSMLSLVERSIIIPAGTNNFYYYLFPDKVSYRGLSKITKMGRPDSSDDVSYRDIAKLVTGVEFTANGSFLAVAYSAAGIQGVICVSILYCLALAINDFFMVRMDGRFQTLALIANLNGIAAICSVPFQVAIFSYGFISSTFLLFLCLTGRRNNRGLMRKPQTP